MDFRGVNLSGVSFMGSDLSAAQFDSSTIFSDGTQGANLSGTNAVLHGITGNLDFRGANLSGVSFMSSDLSAAQFDSTTIFSDGTQGVNLSGTNAVLTGPFSSTDFSNANFFGVNLSTAMINGATFTGSTYDAQTVWPSGFDPVAAGAIGVGINQAPTFTTSSTFSTPENQVTAFQVSANDPEGSAVTFSVTGTDASLFSINAATGQLTFNTPPDFETGVVFGHQPVFGDCSSYGRAFDRRLLR